MPRDRVGDIERLLEEALAVPTSELGDWLRAHCDDEAVRREVRALVAALDTRHDFLEAAHEAEPPHSAPPPDEIGAFRIVRPLGSGGSSRVWLAARHDGSHERLVAIKIPHDDAEPELIRRFLAERRVLASLDHPHIARLFDSGTTDDGRPYFVMEYIPGTPVDLWCDRQRLGIEARIRIFRKVCDAVHYAHQHLVVHRDIKPGNILVTADGEPKLVDFGIAKLLDPVHDDATTRNGLAPLTLAYASPEQLSGRDVATPSDVYSLGLVLYRLLCGRLPDASRQRDAAATPQPPSALVGNTSGSDADLGLASSVEARAATRGTDPKRLRRRLRGDLDRIAVKAIHPEPERRYASCDQLSQDLARELAGLPILARPDSWSYRTRRWMSRNPVAAALALGLLASLVAFSAVMGVQTRRLAAARDRAEREQALAERTTNLVVDLFELSDPERARGRTVSARELLAQGVVRVQAQFAHLPLQRATLLSTLGTLHHKVGLYREARSLLEQAVELQRASGADPSSLAESLIRLGELADDQGHSSRALESLREGLELRQATLGEDDPAVAEARTHLAAALVHAGELGAAEPLLRQALATLRGSGAPPSSRAVALNELALLHMEQGRPEVAEPLLREARALWESNLGADHPHVATALSNLGAVLARQGRHREAVQSYGRALAIRRRVLHPEHPDIPLTLHNLAGSQIALGRFDAADSALQEVLAAHRRIYGDESLEVAKTLSARAGLAQRQGHLELAEKRFEEALEIGRRAMNPGDPGIAYPLLALGRIRMQRGRPELALAPLREALEVRRRSLPDDSPYVAEAEAALAACEQRLSERPVTTQGP